MTSSSSSPKINKAVKLLKFLINGKIAEIDGVNYYLKCVVQSGDSAYTANAMAIDNYTLESLIEIADAMDGKTYNEVMNFVAYPSSDKVD